MDVLLKMHYVSLCAAAIEYRTNNHHARMHAYRSAAVC